MIECGLSEIDITPPPGLPIPGYFQPRKSAGIMDGLYAKAVVIDDGGHAAAIVVLDSIGIEKEETAAIRGRISGATGIPEANIVVAATHTHTGGPVYRDRGPDGADYAAALVHNAANAAITAYRNKRPARIGFAKGAVTGISFNRRYFMRDGTVKTNPGFGNPDIAAPSGPIDPDVIVMRLDAEDGSPLGMITNFACHPDTLGGNRYSADYPGALSRELKAVFGERFVSVFMNGACGNINHLDFMHGVKPSAEIYRQMGKVLAEEAVKVREKAVVRDRIRIDGRRAMLSLDVRSPQPDDLARAELLLRSAEAPGPSDADLFFARQLLALRDRGETRTEAEIQAIRFGELAVVAFPCELFVEFGLELKRRSQSVHTMIAAYANGVNGYVATREAFSQGGYETRLTSRTRLAPDAGERMVSSAIAFLEEWFDSDGRSEL